MKSLSDSLNAGLPSLSLGAPSIGFFAQFDQAIDLHIRGQIKMRNGLDRLRQPRRDCAPHGVEWHFLVAIGCIERFHLRCRRVALKGSYHGRSSQRCQRRLCQSDTLLDVPPDNAAVRSGAAQRRKVNSPSGGKPARQRCDSDAARQPRRAVVVFRRAYLEERIELDRAGITRRFYDCRCWDSHGRRNRLCGGGGHRLSGLGADAIRDHSHDGADGRDVAGRNANFGQHAGRGRRHFHRNLVGLDLEQIVARLDLFAGRLEPLGDLALGDGLAELRHQDVHGRVSGCRLT